MATLIAAIWVEISPVALLVCVASASADGLESYSPADGSLLSRVHTSGAAGYNTIMSQAVAAGHAVTVFKKAS